MPLPQELRVWSETLITDSVNGSPQRRQLIDSEFNRGWTYQQTVTAQQVNQLMYLLTIYSSPSPATPFVYPDTLPVPDIALEMNGQATPAGSILEEMYGANLPNIVADAPTGFTYIVRNA